MNHYDKDRDNVALGKWYTDHVSAMTREGLHAKSDIASELAFRDKQIAERDETIRKLRDPVAEPPVPHVDPDWLSNVIRRADPRMSMTSDELAEKIAEAINGRAK